MPDVAAIGGLLCVFVFALAIGTFIGAVILRVAVALYNKMAGGASSPSSVPEPAFGKAMGITFVTSLVQTVVGFLIGLVTGAGAAGGVVVAQLIPFLVSLLIMAAMLYAMLPTTFDRALVVALCYMLVLILCFGIAVLAFIVFGVALRGA